MKTMIRAKDLIVSYVNHLDEQQAGVKNYVDSGFADLDTNLPGWLHDGRLIVIAGRPGMGKTAFSQQIAEFVATEKTTLFFSLEMSCHEITERSVSRRSGVPITKLTTNTTNLNNGEWDELTKALATFSKLHLLVDDGTFEINEIVTKAKTAEASLEKAGMPPLGCIVVDYIQLIVTKAANRTLEIGQITRALKMLAKALNVPVIALSQLNRGVEGRIDKRPELNDLRESGSIEQDADLIIFLYRDEYYNENSNDKGICEAIARKNRHGPTNTTKLAFSGEKIKFGDLLWK